MITLLKPGYAKIMQLFYKDKSISLHLREISRRTDLFEPSTHRFLNQLEKEKILKSQRDGNLKKYNIKKGPRAYYIFEAFDLERFETLPSIRKKAISTYLNNLSEKPIFALLFGSTAKGTFNNDSDVDLLLVLNKKIDTNYSEKETNALTGINFSTFQITYDDFLKEIKMKEDKVIQSAIASGFPLVNHIQYYEDLYDKKL